MKRYEYYGIEISIPNGYEWVAATADGCILAFEEKPSLARGRAWDTSNIQLLWIAGAATCDDWKDSLRHVSQLKRIGEEPQAEALPIPATLDELQSMIGDWATQTFPHRTQDSIIAHLRFEAMNELHPDCDPLELADVAMMTIDLAHYRGLSLSDLIQQKLEINRSRRWGNPNDLGFVEHIKEGGEQ